MKVPKLLWAVIIALTFVSNSCDWVGDEPTIEGNLNKYFDSQAQRKSFRILTGSGKPYNQKVDWHIVGITAPYSDTYLTKKVDTLSNGDLKISYDWVSFTVREKKSVIDVEVQKNETGKVRAVYLNTSTSGRQITLPDMRVTQRAE